MRLIILCFLVVGCATNKAFINRKKIHDFTRIGMVSFHNEELHNVLWDSGVLSSTVTRGLWDSENQELLNSFTSDLRREGAYMAVPRPGIKDEVLSILLTKRHVNTKVYSKEQIDAVVNLILGGLELEDPNLETLLLLFPRSADYKDFDHQLRGFGCALSRGPLGEEAYFYLASEILYIDLKDREVIAHSKYLDTEITTKEVEFSECAQLSGAQAIPVEISNELSVVKQVDNKVAFTAEEQIKINQTLLPDQEGVEFGREIASESKTRVAGKKTLGEGDVRVNPSEEEANIEEEVIVDSRTRINMVEDSPDTYEGGFLSSKTQENEVINVVSNLEVHKSFKKFLSWAISEDFHRIDLTF